MSLGGTQAYAGEARAVPDLVASAVAAATALGFGECCHPAVGRLLATVAAGVGAATVVETGTGTGAGLAWMVDACGAETRFVGVERDATRATAAADVFAGRPNVAIVTGEAADHWYAHRPDLMVLDGGGGTGKAGDEPIDPRRALAPGGTLVIDDFTPFTAWPPTYAGEPDRARLHWLEHPDLLATEIRVTPEVAVLVARLRSS